MKISESFPISIGNAGLSRRVAPKNQLRSARADGKSYVKRKGGFVIFPHLNQLHRSTETVATVPALVSQKNHSFYFV